MTSMLCLCFLPFSILCCYSISALSISVDSRYTFPQTNIARSTSLSNRQRQIDDEESKDDDIGMNVPIIQIAHTTQSNSKVSKKKGKEPVVLVQETNRSASFAKESSKSDTLYLSKKKPSLPDVDGLDDNNTNADIVFSNKDEENSKAGEKTTSFLIADLCPSMVF